MSEEGVIYGNSTLMFTLTKEGVERNVEKAKHLEQMFSEGYELPLEDQKEIERVEFQPPWVWNPLWSEGPVDPANPELVQIKFTEP